jgi:hypothetical protein
VLKPPRRADWRLFVGVVCGIAFCLAAAVLLRQLPWATYGVKWWANTVQLIGALVTGFGLLYAWARATRFWGRSWPRIRGAWNRLWGRPVQANVYANATSAILIGGEADVWLGLGKLDGLPVEEQLARIDRYINTQLPPQVIGLSQRIRDVRRELKEAQSRSEEAVKQARADAQHAINQLAARLDATQALDLTWAIVGLFITAGGLVLAYWA